MTLKKENKNHLIRRNPVGSFLLLSVFLYTFFSILFASPAAAVSGLMNGKKITGDTDNFLFWLQTYDSTTAPYFTDRFFIDKSGNVGIGITNPTTKLYVAGSSLNTLATTHSLLGGSGNVLVMADNTGTLYSASNPTGTVLLPTGTNGQTLRNNGGTTWVADSNFYNNGTNVGIGTTAPGAKLDIYGGENAIGVKIQGGQGTTYNSLQLYNEQGDYPGVLYKATGGSGNYIANNILFEDNRPDTAGNVGNFFTIYRSGALTKGNIFQVGNTTSANSLVVSNGGNVGIGMTGPTTKLYVAGTSLNTLATTHSLLGNSGNVIVMADNAGTLYATSTASFISGSGLDLWQGTKNGSIYNGDAGAGNVGIGTTTPLAKLVVNSGVNQAAIFTGTGGGVFTEFSITGAGANKLNIYPYNDGNTYLQHDGQVVFAGIGSTTPQLVVNSSGSVGVGTTALTGTRLKVISSNSLSTFDGYNNQVYISSLTGATVSSGKIQIAPVDCGPSSVVGPDGYTYGVITAADSKCWLDRNLGATRVATAFNDSSAYGYLYQWGRGLDGHQITTSGTTGTLSSTDSPGHSNFITSSSSPYDWRSPQNNNLWQGVSGVNNPCPSGFRLPTKDEWVALVAAEGITNSATAYSSSLKLPVAGYRNPSSASLSVQGSYGYYWSSTPYGTNAYHLNFNSSAVYPAYYFSRANGFSVRCLKD